ncbi:UDP-N-acetylglucosamine 1-carboxyvinyltransferase [Erysipelothrix sp. strain 2 (EsS2-6-Brazil)]|uniref:UDP-N-acetylglucosamine 1-carboxyvinyltransferase n=1 Tax=Erysipelothrix sp. strain 2 (EsS2-6-Brazil) TaxID=2500549 RepID=UPI00190C0A9E|nr:UDP-N-acetylglucosamine 1-carboxyvinyltransferase [Erysipelothrix sp. strain 2 (EsS2-6-Brazil)]MBK2402143.1 UDP-N-acetylglucosamine 1-carboxyvinyltransferase [Erysipelothrix sp. strain 2 (EsS2-6-Brazil)]
MAKVIKIEGGHRLNGKVRISGAKNATVALIPAAILASDSEVNIYGVPNISDVESLSVLLRELNVNVSSPTPDHFQIDTTGMKNVDLDHEAVTKLRASYYFMGALLGKYRYVKMQMPGGCYLGPRPFDLHLKGFEALGASIEYKHGFYEISAERLVGAKIYLDFQSVGATINIMLAAVLAEGKTIIENAAKEPEIIDVANFLNKMGANIRGAGTNVITIEGVERLTGKPHEMIPDRIEAGTYIIMAAAAADDMTIENIIPQHLDALISKLIEMGVDIEVGVDYARIRKSDKPLEAIDITTQTYPGFATDLQQPLTALLTQTHGHSTVKETIYAERFKHCNELNRMGANIQLIPAQASIEGPSKLYGSKVVATDLRCGACLVIAGLIAEGVTEISEIYHIDRGYDDIDNKLTALGGVIWREDKA